MPFIVRDREPTSARFNSPFIVPCRLETSKLVWGTVSVLLYGLSGSAFTWPIFIAGAFINALPGIIIQIILIPAILIALKKGRIIGNE